MKKVFFAALAALTLWCTAFFPVEKQQFVLNNIPKAQAEAQATHRLLLVQFTATWCAPCQMMEQNTWTHPDLIAYMRDNCVAAKVDIDNFDGMSFTHQYKVKNVPTMLVFSADGRLLGRYENSISATHLIRYLGQYNLPENRGSSTDLAPSATAPASQFIGPEPEPAMMANKPGRSLTDVLAEFGKKKSEAASDHWVNGETSAMREAAMSANADNAAEASQDMLSPQASDMQEAPTMAALSTVAKPFVSRVIAPVTKVKPVQYAENQSVAPQQLLYTVQLGAYAQKRSAVEFKKAASDKLKQNVVVLEPTEVHDKYFRLITGTFYTREQANKYAKAVQKNGIDSFVRILPEGEMGMFSAK